MLDSENKQPDSLPRRGAHAKPAQPEEAPRARHAAPPAAAPETQADSQSAAPKPQAETDAPRRKRAESADAQADEYDVLNDLSDESEVPLRLRRRKKPAAKKKRAAHKKNTRGGGLPPLFSDVRFRRKKSIFEVLSASDERPLVKPLRIFGHEIRLWPLFLLILLFMLVGVAVISNGNIEGLGETVSVVGLQEDLENYGILVLSDLNGKRFGDQQSVLIREVEAQDYDIIVCLGDMVGKSGDPEPFYEFLEGLSKPSKVYFICGDMDPGPYLSAPRATQGTLQQIVLEDWILGAIERGANYVDAPVCLSVGEGKLWLTPTGFMNLDASSYRENWKEQMEQEEDGVVSGLSADYNTLPFTSYRYALAQKFYDAVTKMSASDILIGLSHQIPDDNVIKSAATHASDDGKFMYVPELILSGHYCGGVWKIPFLGAFYVPNRMLPRHGWFPAREDVSGLSKIGETQAYITGGLSSNSAVPLLPFRLINPPEMTLVTLTAKLPESLLLNSDG